MVMQMAGGDPAHVLIQEMDASVNPDLRLYKHKIVGQLREFEK